jgi:hypothetical protein
MPKGKKNEADGRVVGRRSQPRLKFTCNSEYSATCRLLAQTGFFCAFLVSFPICGLKLGDHIAWGNLSNRVKDGTLMELVLLFIILSK